jgi:hypothetical protein
LASPRPGRPRRCCPRRLGRGWPGSCGSRTLSQGLARTKEAAAEKKIATVNGGHVSTHKLLTDDDD